MRAATLFESDRSNHTKPAFDKLSALLLFLLESHHERPGLITKYQYRPRLCSLPHPFVKKKSCSFLG